MDSGVKRFQAMATPATGRRAGQVLHASCRTRPTHQVVSNLHIRKVRQSLQQRNLMVGSFCAEGPAVRIRDTRGFQYLIVPPQEQYDIQVRERAENQRG